MTPPAGSLRRGIGRFDAVALVVGSMIGSGIFIVSADSARLLRSGPLLLAVSRKDFIGAVTGRPTAQRDAGTLAALGHGADAGAHVFRVHDVAAAADFLAVRAVLRGDEELPSQVSLDEALRHEPPAGAS